MDSEKKYWFVARCNGLGAELRQSLMRLPYECYIPMMEKSLKINGREEVREVPMAFSYVFFRARDFYALKETLTDYSRVRLLYKTPDKDAKFGSVESHYRPAIVRDVEMEMFKKVVSVYSHGAPVAIPDKALMDKGDKVRITSGPFEGIEGTLVSSQGRDGGKVIVSIGNLLSVSTVDISPEHIRVLRFAHGNKHIYRKMDSFALRLDKIREKLRGGIAVSEEEKESVRVFMRRFGDVETETINTAARLQMLLTEGCSVLGMSKDKERGVRKLKEEILPNVKSVKVKEKIDSFLNAL